MTKTLASGCLIVIVQLISCVRLLATPWTAAHQASLSFTISPSLLKLMSIESMMPALLNRFGEVCYALRYNRKWQPTPVLLPKKCHGQRSLVGYSPWVCKESYTTEQLHFSLRYNYYSKRNIILI